MCSSESTARQRQRGPFWLALRVLVFAVIFVGFAEIWFRVAMPADQAPLNYESHPSTLSRFDPSSYTSGVHTIGRLCLGQTRWHINNDGWNCAYDYSVGPHHRLVIALFGDSYVEGFATNTTNHLEAYMSRFLRPAVTYAFGQSGWYLEQCVATARYVRHRFDPDVIVVLVGDGDVRDSIQERGEHSAFWWQIATGQTGAFVEVAPRAQYRLIWKARAVRESALANYLRYNAAVSLPGMNSATTGQSPSQPAAAVNNGWQSLLPAASFMIRALRQQNPRTPIVFVANDARYLPVRSIPQTPLSDDVHAVEIACRTVHGCYFLDTRWAFSRDWKRNHVRFEAADGGHWNAYANRLVAGTLADFLVRHRIVEPATD